MVATSPHFVAHCMAGDRAASANLALTLERPQAAWPALTPPETAAWPDRSASRSVPAADTLASVVVLHVLPRLTLDSTAADAGHRIPGLAIAEFTARLQSADLAPALAFAQATMQRGCSAASLYLDLFEPAARRLGELWSLDRLDFTGVTIGLVRLHQLLRAFSPTFHTADAAPRPDRDILLVAPPGAQHMFGVCMVRAFFQRAGWRVWNNPPATDRGLGATVRKNRFDVVGFSVACEDQLPAVRASIRTVRRASQNRHVIIMVGGPACLGHKELAAELGADASATDADHAVKQAERLLAVRAPRG